MMTEYIFITVIISAWYFLKFIWVIDKSDATSSIKPSSHLSLDTKCDPGHSGQFTGIMNYDGKYNIGPRPELSARCHALLVWSLMLQNNNFPAPAPALQISIF